MVQRNILLDNTNCNAIISITEGSFSLIALSYRIFLTVPVNNSVPANSQTKSHITYNCMNCLEDVLK